MAAYEWWPREGADFSRRDRSPHPDPFRMKHLRGCPCTMQGGRRGWSARLQARDGTALRGHLCPGLTVLRVSGEPGWASGVRAELCAGSGASGYLGWFLFLNEQCCTFRWSFFLTIPQIHKPMGVWVAQAYFKANCCSDGSATLSSYGI